MKKVAIVLGYCLNKDASMDAILVRRLDMMLKLLKEEHIDNIIVSGGKAAKGVDVSEAEAMYNYLVANGVNKNMIIMEDKSTSTVENAKFSIPIAKKLGADVIVIVTTMEHFISYSYNPLKIFSDTIGDDSMNIMVYTNAKPLI